ncbi:MAG: ATP-binding cassette domain-containing protein, partial [Oscillospiraceae bacterium]|nr:ATP-binding cassette domain-containing protein [Oscillospiraceae bacterium]
MAHFQIKDLTFSYPTSKDKKSLDSVNLSIEKGEYIVLCGKSGSGKTTLLRQLKSVLAPHGKRNGEVLFNGTPLEKVSQRDQSSKIGYVMQNPDDQIV